MKKITFFKVDMNYPELKAIVQKFGYDYDPISREWFSADSTVVLNGKT